MGSGAVVLVEEVSHSRLAEVTQIIKVPASHTVKLRQPPQSVWLVTVFDKAPGAELTRKPDADSTVRAGKHAAKNHGGLPDLVVRNHSTSPHERSAALLRFSLAGIKLSDVRLAVLEVNGHNPAGGPPLTAHVYGLAGDSWQESAVTWQKAANLEATGGVVDQIRHNYVSGVGSTADIVGHLTASGALAALRLDVTGFIRRQSDGGASFLVVREVRFPGDVDDKGSLVIASRESKTGPAPALRLFLRPGATLPKPDAGPPPADKGPMAGDGGAPAADGSGDAGRPDASRDARLQDTAGEDGGGGGCSCRAGGGRTSMLLVFSLLLLWAGRRATSCPRRLRRRPRRPWA